MTADSFLETLLAAVLAILVMLGIVVIASRLLRMKR